MNVQELEATAAQVRRDIIRMTAGVQSGHPGGSMSACDLMVGLFFDTMSFNPQDYSVEARGEDVFYLSNGHISPALYSVLARRGFFDIKELGTFRLLGSRLQGHPAPVTGLPGVRVASGSLGQGVSVAVGHAAAKKMEGDSSVVFVMTGDGELQEGQIWEAAMFASARQIDNVVVVVDMNNQQIDGTCQQVMAQSDLASRWAAFGWEVVEMDGHDMEGIVATFSDIKTNKTGKGKPVVVLAHTVMGKGVDFMEDTNEYHGKVTNFEQTERALAQLTETLGDY